MISSGLTIRYHSEREGEIYATQFPGPLDGDESEINELSHMDFHPVSGGIVDLTDLHSRLIAYLGDEGTRENFLAETSYQNVLFLEEEDGYLTRMLCGFKYYINKNLEENGPYTYYPVYNWGAGSMRSVMDVVCDVPEGYKIRRSVQNEGNLQRFRGSQVLEQYTGKGQTLSVPMGVTEVALKGRQGEGSITSLVLPESVCEVDFASVSECLPGLEEYQASGHSRFRVTDGVLYSGDGHTLLSVPAGKKELTIPDTVTAIERGAFKNCRIRELTIPDTVTELRRGCFEGFHADVIRMEGTFMPRVSGETGYTRFVGTESFRKRGEGLSWSRSGVFFIRPGILYRGG